jgi:hypothetical protein
MHLWQHTLKEVLGDKQPYPDAEAPNCPREFVPASVVPITANPAYATALIKGIGSFAHQTLLEWRDGAWHVVGEFVDDTMTLQPSARGKGLAEELFLRCIAHRDQLPVSSNFTKRGYSLTKRAHRLVVEHAVKAGLPVPSAVLDDYPDLKQQADALDQAP